MRNIIFGLLAVSAASTGCKWTDFDDLEDSMWVESVGKPDSNSTDYGIAMTRSQRASDDGGLVTVLGAGQALFSELQFKAAGGGSLVSATEEKLNTQFGIGNLDAHPILIASPDSDDVALVTNSGGTGSIALLAGTHTMTSSQVFGPSIPDGAVYFKAASQQTSKIFVGSGDSVYGFAAPPATQPKCPLVDEAGAAIAIAGMTNVRLSGMADDDVAVFAKDGKVYIYPGTTFDGCTPSAAPLFPAVDLSFPNALHNAQMFTVANTAGDASHYLIVGAYIDGADEKATLAVVDLSGAAPALVGTPVGKAGMKSLAFLDVADGKFILAGFPLEDIDGTSAGELLALPFDEATGVINPTPTMILHDAQPSDNQLFGRSVAVVQYNGKPVIAVGASNEVFFYYQATPLYGETRRR